MVSILAVASSRISSSGFLSAARMNAISCFCPRLMLSPLDVTFVSSPCSKRTSSSPRLFCLQNFDQFFAGEIAISADSRMRCCRERFR